MNKEPLNVYGRQCVRTMLIDFARSENLVLSMDEKDDWFNVRFRTARGSKEFNILWTRCENAWETVNTVIKHTQAWMEKYKCDSESISHLEVGKAFSEGFEAGLKYADTKTYKKSDEDLASEIKKVVYEEAKNAVTLEIMFGTNKNKTTLTPETVREVFKKATDNGVLKPKTDLSKMYSDSLEQYILEPKIIPKAVSGITIHGLAGDCTYKLDPDDMKIKHMDIDEWSKMPPYLAQQQIYITTARGGGKTWYSEEWRKFMEQLEKEPKVKPLSRKDEEAMYIKQDVEMTSLLYKNFNMPRAKLPEIKNVIFNDPATIVMWADGTKTVVQCQDGDIYDPEKGLAMAISKKIMGNKRDYYHTFKHWLKRVNKEDK